MRHTLRLLLTISLTVLLAGCFMSEHSLYKGVAPARPFRDGTVLIGDGDKTSRMVLHEVSPGVYLLRDRSRKEDTDNPVRFYPLSGLVPGTMVVEVYYTRLRQLEPPGQTDKFHPFYDYGLWLPQSGGWRSVRPDCSKLPGVARLPGVKHRGENCTFTSRASLEAALRMAATQKSDPARPDTIFTVDR